MASQARLRIAAGALAGAIIGLAQSAQADLGGDSQTLEAEWRGFATVRRLPPVLVERGQLRPLLPLRQLNEEEGGCTTVAILGVPSSVFVVRFLPNGRAMPVNNAELPERSRAGTVQLVRCGDSRASLGRLAVEMRSPRGVIEAVVATASEPMPALALSLPHREPGKAPPPIDPGSDPGPDLAAVPEDLLRSQARNRGATRTTRTSVRPREQGNARIRFPLGPGCHEFIVGSGSPSTSERGPVDMDAELLALPSGAELASDREDAALARLHSCSPQAQQVELRFFGAHPQAPAAIVHNEYPFPSGVPSRWGPAAQRSLANLLWESRMPLGMRSPVQASLGIGGTTHLGWELQPGACYRAAVVVLRGRSSHLALTVRLGLEERGNRAPEESQGTTVGFCAGDEEQGKLTVEADGSSLVWLLVGWEDGQMPLGEAAE